VIEMKRSHKRSVEIAMLPVICYKMSLTESIPKSDKSRRGNSCFTESNELRSPTAENGNLIA